jgi:2-polyprenyl-3-methyl-5-hydroxy-6-metoxy-1,4-benzoquinol methylase
MQNIDPNELNRNTYNQIAQHWHEDHLNDDWWIEGTSKFMSFFKPGDTMLDIGCAGGKKSAFMKEHGLTVTGIDISEEMIKIAQARAPEVTFRILNLDEIDQLPGTFDGLFMQAVLLHVPKSQAPATIKKLVGKLKPGGYFYIAVKEQSPDNPPEEILNENKYGYPYQRFFSYYMIEEIRDYFEQAELTVISEDISQHGKTNWIQVIARKS